MKKIIAIILRPFLYTRWSWIIPVTIVWVFGWRHLEFNKLCEVSLFVGVFWMFVMFGFQSLGVSVCWYRFLCKIFRVKYIHKGYWMRDSDNPLAISVYQHPEIEVKGKIIQMSFATMGGAKQEPEAHIKRQALVSYLWN